MISHCMTCLFSGLTVADIVPTMLLFVLFDKIGTIFSNNVHNVCDNLTLIDFGLGSYILLCIGKDDGFPFLISLSFPKPTSSSAQDVALTRCVSNREARRFFGIDDYRNGCWIVGSRRGCGL